MDRLKGLGKLLVLWLGMEACRVIVRVRYRLGRV